MNEPLLHSSLLDSLRDFQHNPAWFAIVFSTIVFCFALLVSTMKRLSIVHVITFAFFVGLVTISGQLWLDARSRDIDERTDELQSCLDDYVAHLDPKKLRMCMDEYEETQIIKNEARVNIGYFLNVTTEFTSEVVMFLLLFAFGREAFLFLEDARLYPLIFLAIMTPMLIGATAPLENVVAAFDHTPFQLHTVQSLQEWLINLSTEFMGTVVIIMAVNAENDW